MRTCARIHADAHMRTFLKNVHIYIAYVCLRALGRDSGLYAFWCSLCAIYNTCVDSRDDHATTAKPTFPSGAPFGMGLLKNWGTTIDGYNGGNPLEGKTFTDNIHPSAITQYTNAAILYVAEMIHHSEFCLG